VLALLLLQVPPVVVLLSVTGDERHKEVIPEIGSGNGFTVTVLVAIQPSGSIYVTIVVPALTPVSNPKEFIVATDVLPEIQLPPVVISVYSEIAPTQIDELPAIGDGKLVTVTGSVV
jgi:hypothetical protein